MVLTDGVSVASLHEEYLHTSADDVDTSSARPRVTRSVGMPSYRVQFSGSSTCKLKVRRGTANYLLASSTAQHLTVGLHSHADITACFRIHRFNVLSPNNSLTEAVMVESLSASRYLQGSNTGTLSLTASSESSLSSVSMTDARFFIMVQPVGHGYLTLKHLESDMLVSTMENGSVSLTSGEVQDHKQFQWVNCTHRGH